MNIYWVKVEKIFKGARVHDDGSVFIRKVRLQDSGDYECYSKDEARLLFGSVKLKVIGMKHFLLYYSLFKILKLNFKFADMWSFYLNGEVTSM